MKPLLEFGMVGHVTAHVMEEESRENTLSDQQQPNFQRVEELLVDDVGPQQVEDRFGEKKEHGNMVFDGRRLIERNEKYIKTLCKTSNILA